jgi:hypothetical protein
VDECARLVGADGDEVRVGVAEGADGDAGGQVEVLPPVGVIELAAAAGHDDDARAVVGADEVPRLVLDDRPARCGQLTRRARRGRSRRGRRHREAGGDAAPAGRREPHPRARAGAALQLGDGRHGEEGGLDRVHGGRADGELRCGDEALLSRRIVNCVIKWCVICVWQAANGPGQAKEKSR